MRSLGGGALWHSAPLGCYATGQLQGTLHCLPGGHIQGHWGVFTFTVVHGSKVLRVEPHLPCTCPASSMGTKCSTLYYTGCHVPDVLNLAVCMGSPHYFPLGHWFHVSQSPRYQTSRYPFTSVALMYTVHALIVSPRSGFTLLKSMGEGHSNNLPQDTARNLWQQRTKQSTLASWHHFRSVLVCSHIEYNRPYKKKN